MKTIFYLLLFFTLETFGQIKTGSVTYNLTIADDIEMEKGMMADYYKDAKKNAKLVSYTLNFDENQMIFSTNPSLKIDGQGDVSFAEAFSGVEGKYYREKKSNTILNEIDGANLGHLIVKKEFKLKWALTKETKMIDQYLCYKATSELIIKNTAGQFKREIIAWYCPKISISFGPKGYGDLPGLILELQEKNAVFGATKITLNSKDVKITKPSKGKIVSEEELNVIIEKSTPKG